MGVNVGAGEDEDGRGTIRSAAKREGGGVSACTAGDGGGGEEAKTYVRGKERSIMKTVLKDVGLVFDLGALLTFIQDSLEIFHTLQTLKRDRFVVTEDLDT